MKRAGFSLTIAILSSVALVLIVTWVLLGIVSYKTTERNLFAQKADEGRRLLVALIGLLPSDPSLAASSPAITRLVETLRQDGTFEGVVITDASGTVVFAVPHHATSDARLDETLLTGPTVALSPDRQRLSCYERIVSDGIARGAARLTLSLAAEHDRLSGFNRIYLAYFGLNFLVLLSLGSFLLSRLIVVPIRKLLTATHHIAAGDLSHRVPVSGNIEVAELARSFNSMVEALAVQRDEIQQNVASLETANEELKKAREETIRSEKMASVGLLAAGMAHEVGTPLAAIMGYATILREEVRGDPERSEHVQRIIDDTRRIDRIVRNLLDYARPRKDVFGLVNAGELLRGVYELLDAQGVFKNIRVRLTITDGLPDVRVDGHQLQQVLINLILNARDAMPRGGDLEVTASRGEFTITSALPPSLKTGMVMGRRRDDFRGVFQNPLRVGDRPVPCLKIEVRDSGEGIPPEHVEKLFDPFFTTKEPGKGTGLGLAICARIIDTFNGRITVQSTVGTGSTFCIWLPQESE